MSDEPKHLDLYSGIGGFALAFQRARFQTVAFAEIDPYASAVLWKHWPNIQNLGDVEGIDTRAFRGIDVITAGFNCQPFSVGGRRKGKADSRYVWPTVIRTLREIGATWFVGENVVGIANMVLSECLDDLEGEGYQSAAFDISACAVGLPTVERHVWIIATRADDGLEGFKESLASQQQRIELQRRQIHSSAEGWPGFTDLPAPYLLRSRKGLSGYVDRIRCLGNAIDPRVAEVIAQAIYQQIKGTKCDISPK